MSFGVLPLRTEPQNRAIWPTPRLRTKEIKKLNPALGSLPCKVFFETRSKQHKKWRGKSINIRLSHQRLKSWKEKPKASSHTLEQNLPDDSASSPQLDESQTPQSFPNEKKAVHLPDVFLSVKRGETRGKKTCTYCTKVQCTHRTDAYRTSGWKKDTEEPWKAQM